MTARARRLLLLGGTAEASAMARALDGDPTWTTTISLAGRTSKPLPLPGEVRIGGFGGPEGLARALHAGGYDALVDATHPFAAHMRWNAAEASAATGVPRLRVERPPFAELPGDRWRRVPTIAAAAEATDEAEATCVFLTIGRTELHHFARGGPARRWVVRSVDQPDVPPPGDVTVVLDRGPFDEAAERQLMRRHGVDLLVTKDSGGPAGKLAAARSLGVEVLVVDRPSSPPGRTAATAEEALDWLRGLAP